MAKTVAIDIVTPERVVYHDEIRMIIVPAQDGYLGVLPGHSPLVTGVKIGVLNIKKDDGSEFFISTSGGILEVRPDQVNLLVASAELPDEIDVDRALSAKARAEERLHKVTADVDETRARAALERAIARLKAAGHE